MRPPAIRYPLLWLIGLGVGLFLTLVAWPWTRPFRESWRAARPAMLTTRFPASERPRPFAGPVPWRALLRRDEVPARTRPDGPIAETLGRRMFVAVYDVWPSDGEPTHYRIGNVGAFGWVAAADLLDWPTRLVYEAPGPDATSDRPPIRPIVDWSGDRIRLDRWGPTPPGTRPDASDWVRIAGQADDRLAVLLSRRELLEILARLNRGQPAEEVRLRALTGTLLEPGTWTEPDRFAVRSGLPAWAAPPTTGAPETALEGLARVNEDWATQLSISGIEFRAIPLRSLP